MSLLQPKPLFSASPRPTCCSPGVPSPALAQRAQHPDCTWESSWEPCSSPPAPVHSHASRAGEGETACVYSSLTAALFFTQQWQRRDIWGWRGSRGHKPGPPRVMQVFFQGSASEKHAASTWSTDVLAWHDGAGDVVDPELLRTVAAPDQRATTRLF